MKIFLELIKFKICALVALSTAMGFILANGKLEIDIFVPIGGIFFLAAGSSAMNQYIERTTDALMPRTQGRPVPTGKITPYQAVLISFFLIISGFMVFKLYSSLLCMALGGFAVIWYNLVYSFWKRKNAFAVIPGSIIGAISPMVGWVYAGGDPFDPIILAVAFFFIMWQIPHFWLLMLIYGNDYEKAGLPSITNFFSHNQLTRITFIWIISASVSGLMLPFFGAGNSIGIKLLLILLALWITYTALKLLKTDSKELLLRLAFINVNIYALLIILLLSIDKLITS